MGRKKDCPCMKGMFWGGVASIVGRGSALVAKHGGAKAVAGMAAKKIAIDQAKVQGQRGVFSGIQAIQDRNIAKIAKKRILFRDDYSDMMDAARDRGDMKAYFRYGRLADQARDRGTNPIRRGAHKGGVVKNVPKSTKELFRILPITHRPQASAVKDGFLGLYRM